MSITVGSKPFWQQNQSWSTGQASANSRFFSGRSVFGSNILGDRTEAAISAGTTAMNAFGSAQTNYYMDAGILAAEQGVERMKKAAELKNNGGLTKPVGDIGDQVTFSGTLSGLVDFGADGPSAIGGFRFQSGAALKQAFDSAMLAEKSHGEAIDTVTVTGNTLTASTSGPEAHPVFTITLKPDSGLWTFKLVNPIDGAPLDKSTKFITSLKLSGLMQGVKSTGETIALPNNISINIYGDPGRSSGKDNNGSVHQGWLVYTPPDKIETPVTIVKRPPYQAPINPATGRRYVSTATTTGSAAIGATVNLFY